MFCKAYQREFALLSVRHRRTVDMMLQSVYPKGCHRRGAERISAFLGCSNLVGDFVATVSDPLFVNVAGGRRRYDPLAFAPLLNLEWDWAIDILIVY